MKKEDAGKLASGVEGYLSDKEGSLLYDLALRVCSAGDVVEIGSWKGKSTVWLAAAVLESGSGRRVYAVDPHTGSKEHREAFGKVWTFDEFLENIRHAGVEKAVVPLVKTSEDAAKSWQGVIGLLWIDGAHDYESVRIDFESWEPFLAENSVIAFHDTDTSDPRRFVERYVYRGNKFKEIGFMHGITYATKSAEVTTFDKINNRYKLCWRNLYLWVAAMKPPSFVKKAGNCVLKLLMR